jgi:hypothetical protein
MATPAEKRARLDRRTGHDSAQREGRHVKRNQKQQKVPITHGRFDRGQDFTSFYVELLKEPGRREVIRCWANNRAMAQQLGELFVEQRRLWKVGRVLTPKEAKAQLPKWWAYLRCGREVYYARDELGLTSGRWA